MSLSLSLSLSFILYAYLFVLISSLSLSYRYTFEEAAAVRKVQAAWAGLKGRRAFRDQLARQSIRGLGVACINEASSHAWIGHEEVRQEGGGRSYDRGWAGGRPA